ncbi:hypothetical protein [Lysobacter auxotrophicus]|uniref:Uncharacterized protein n=1 Tax=Lysobacter auxotrophicus TaxID=2992573 RepID=A0ABM8DHT8_9GAMM|nr:hypothetical protein [Lysobacter auxotrophicus]BDU18213.1 hypothetical protein LA521A_34140 [Lysobacter auxotrophicus]
MTQRALGLAMAALAALATTSAVHAQDACTLDIGRGWPPATENYGTAVEQLFFGGTRPVLSLTRLPARSVESGVQLYAGEGEGDWRLRFTQADERVEVWSGGKRELRVGQQPDVVEVPMPAALARRVVTDWQRALGTQVPADRAAQFHDGEVLLFVVDDTATGQPLRFSGLQPGCGPAAELMEQVGLLIEATDDSDEKRFKRWRELEESLDQLELQLEQTLAGATG